MLIRECGSGTGVEAVRLNKNAQCIQVEKERENFFLLQMSITK